MAGNFSKDRALSEDAVLTRDFYPPKPLPEGEYDFTVTDIFFRRFDETEYTQACKGAVVTLRLRCSDGKKTRNVKTWFKFTEANEPKMCSFLRAVGLKKVGEGFTLPDFSNCLGKSGKGYFCVSKDGKYNNVGFFIDPDGIAASEFAEKADFNMGDAPIEEDLSEEEIEEMKDWFSDPSL